MQELRFVGLEDEWLIATNENGDRFRLRADESLREALRARPATRSEAPRVPPRQIQQLIRAGRTVAEVVELTGADAETVERFEGPILAERGYIVEQARAVAVRLQSQIDPLSREGATFGSTLDDRLEQLGATDVRWDAWKDPETGWHIGLNFVTEDVARNALWSFDSRAHTLHPSSPAAVTLSQQGQPTSLAGPHLRAVKRDSTDQVIPFDDLDTIEESLTLQGQPDLTTHETADLLEALRRRRGERQHATYGEEAEFGIADDVASSPSPFESTHSVGSRVMPFPRPSASEKETDAPVVDGNDTTTEHAADPTSGDSSESAAAPTSDSVFSRLADAHELTPRQVPLEQLESEPAPETSVFGKRGKQGRKRSGRPSMPSWDEIVFGTKGDDE